VCEQITQEEESAEAIAEAFAEAAGDGSAAASAAAQVLASKHGASIQLDKAGRTCQYVYTKPVSWPLKS
jgi:hypothetical protein